MPDRSSMRFTCWLRPSWIVSSTTPVPDPAHHRGRRHPVVELDPGGELSERLISQDRPRPRRHRPCPPRSGVGEPVRELAVVREQQHAGRVDVEPADRDDAGGVVDEIDDGRPPPRIARRRDDTGRLVQQHVREPLLGENGAVELHPVAGLDERVQLPGLAVHEHSPGFDQLVRSTPRRNPGPREPCIQTHEEKFRFWHAPVTDTSHLSR